MGIRGSARLLGISQTTLLSRIRKIASNIEQLPIIKRQTYEIDEMRTFVKKKEKLIWIVYALNQKTKEVVSFNVGSRTNKTLNWVIKTVVNSNPDKIFTDKLKNYKYLIDSTLHSTKHKSTNHIERKNLTLRTHLKRLSRRTISFSKSIVILCCILKIYFWG